MPLEKVGRADALTKAEFHRRLREWLRETDDAQVGSEAVPGLSPWVYVSDGGNLFNLHADTKRASVEWYIEKVTLHGDELAWEIVPSRQGNPTAIVYGPERLRQTSFYLYAVPST